MYQCAEICFPRKKRVPECFHSNTYRIFDENVPERLDPSNAYKDHGYPRRSSEECSSLKTHNIPHPRNAKFIRTNVRWLNKPVSQIETESAVADQFHWWPSGHEKNMISKAPYSRDSTQRSDFQAPPVFMPSTRNGSSPSTSAASGIVPTVNPLGHQKVLHERISFIHQYNSRKLQDQPYQGKHHGAFVWNEIKPVSGLRAPSGDCTFLSSEGSRSQPAQQKVQRGNGMTSLQLALCSPQQMLDTGRALSSGQGLKAAAASTCHQMSAKAPVKLSTPLKADQGGSSTRHDEVSLGSASVTEAPKLWKRAHSLDICTVLPSTMCARDSHSLP